MKLTLRAITLFLLLLAAAATASAGPVTLTLNNGGTDTMGGVYVGPYNFTSSTGSLQLICDDYIHEVWGGESWTATTSTFSPLPSAGLQFASSSMAEVAQYEEAAWLAQQIFALSGNPANATTIAYMQYALWDIFDSTASSGLGSLDPTDQVGYWLGQAQTNYSTGNYSDVVIYTPVSGTQVPNGDPLPQEYLGIISTPEPGSLLLIGAGLFSLLAFRRRLSY